MRTIFNEVIDDEILIKNSIVPSINIDLETIKILKDASSNEDFMKAIDLTEINHGGGYELASNRDYVEANAEFQYWANIIMYGKELPYEKPDLPTLQTKVVEPRLDDFEVEADTGYELEKVIVKGVTAKVDPNVRPENIKQGVSILGVDGSVIERLPVKEENIMIMKITDRAMVSLNGSIELASDEEYSKAEDRIQYLANIILNGGADV